MCGIHGIFHFTGAPADVRTLRAMAQSTVHRGPDDEGHRLDGECGIGMRRLSIIDLAGGHQPMSNRDRTIWLVANGEIYNFRELRADLERKGHRFNTNSDCETLIHLYAEHGEGFLRHVNGMFGFALWDSVRRKLLIGRDRLGIKPVYYLYDGRRLAFASEAKALLELDGVTAEVDSTALAAYLELGYVPTPLSIFRGIRKLPPASLMSVEREGFGIRSYWSLPDTVEPDVSPDDWVERIRSRMEESVRMQMVSDVPIGAFLSGGIDSSAVLAFMSRHSDSPVRTYSIGFQGGASDRFYNELPYARRVATDFRTEHHEILVRPDVVRLLPKLLWHMDEPIADSAFVTTYLVAELAAREVKVILSGVGGDELFGGYRRYLGEHYLRYFQKFPAFARKAAVTLSTRLPSDRHSPLLNLSRYAKSFVASADRPFQERYRSYLGVFDPVAARDLMRQAESERFDALAVAFQSVSQADSLNAMFGVDARTQLPDDLLLLTDKMTMATSLECRVPLLDHELVEIAARIPEKIKVSGGELKHVMKKALDGVLPREVLHRSKRGFGAPMGAWLKAELSELLDAALSRESIESRGLFHFEPVRRLIDDHRANRVDGTDRLLALLNFEVWCRVFLDGQSSAQVSEELREAVA